MRVIPTSLKFSPRSCTSISTALLFALTVCLSGVVAQAQVPSSADIVLSQTVALGALPGDGAQSGSEPAGDTMAVNSMGDVIATNTYNNQVLLYTPQGVQTILGSISNPNGVAVDSQNNLYIGLSYSSQVVKIPYVNGAYVAIAATSSSTPNCNGNDMAECVMSNVGSGTGVVSMVFDAAGDMFYATNNNSQYQSGPSPNALFECTAACLYSATGSPAPVLLFTEPPSSAPTTAGQLYLGGLAIDASGDLFFTDSSISSTSSDNQESFSSNLNELPYTSGAYATKQTVIYSYTPTSFNQSNAEIDGVAVAPNGTVYALIQNTIGILAFPNVSGAYSSTTMYLVGTTPGKLLAGDKSGNLYEADDNGNMTEITLNNLVATPSAANAPSTATNITTILNDGGCTPTPTVTFTPGGSSASEFGLSIGACSSVASSSTTTVASFPTTLTFTPSAVGTATATLAVTDSNSGSLAATVSGVGAGTVADPIFALAAGTYTGTQSLTLTDATLGASIYYTTDGSTPGANTGTSTLYSGAISISNSETVNAIAVDPGDTSSAVATAAYVINIAGAYSTPVFSTAGGTFTTPQVVSLTDSTAGALIYYTTDGSAPSTTSTLYTGPIGVVSTETINAIAAGGGAPNSGVATALFTITLPASAFQNIVMTQSTQFGTLPSSGGAQSGAAPAGNSMAINSFGDVIVGNTYGSDVTLYTPQGVQTILGMPAGSGGNVAGVAVDSQNNLFVAQGYSATVLKIPYVNGAYVPIVASSGTTPACTETDAVECVLSSVTNLGADVVSMVFDAKGDLFFTTGNDNDGGGSDQNSIYECTAACLYATGGSPAPVLLYQEPEVSTSVQNASGQLSVGGIALDAAGDVFFTDSAIGMTNNEESFSSDLDELPVLSTASTGYAAAPTVIYTHTPVTAANYDDEIDGVAVAPNGTVYAIVENADGILAFPNSSTGYSSKTVYLVSSQSGKLLASDVLGNLYEADNNNNIYQISVDNLVAPTSPIQNLATVADVTTYLNDGGCTATPPTVSFAADGTSTSTVTAATTGTCTGTAIDAVLTGASFTTSVSFTPGAVGSNMLTLTATDSLNNTGTAVVSGQGTPAPPAATPTFSVPAGDYTTVQTVTITDTTANATIYYTTDGSTPTTASTPYTAPINVATDETINAIATATGFTSSPVATALYNVMLPIAATPTFSVAAGTYTTPQTVTITDTTPGVSIYFTIDGSMPTSGSTLYTAPITVGVTETINAIAVPATPTTSYASSTVASALYTINLPAVATPAFSVAAGTFTTVQSVTLSDATAGATIYYTTDGSAPTTASTAYTTSITVAVSTTINAIAVDADYNNSAIATAAYVINLPATSFTITAPANPTITVIKGTGSITLTLTANAAFNGSMSFACSGFLPVGATCTFSPTNVTLAALANATTKLTVTVPKATAALHRGPNPLLPETMVAAALCLLGVRKRRRIRMLLMLVIGVAGLSMFSGCTTTSSTTTSSSQITVTATGSSLAVNAPPKTEPTSVSASVPLVLTIQ